MTPVIDVWFYALVTAAVVLRLLLSDDERPSLKGAFTSSLSAFVVAKIGTDPLLHFMGTDSPDRYRDAVVVCLGLVGNEIVAGALSTAKNPTSAVNFIMSYLTKRFTK